MSLFVKAIDKLQIERARRKREVGFAEPERQSVSKKSGGKDASRKPKVRVVGKKPARKLEQVCLLSDAMRSAGMIVDDEMAPRLRNEMRRIKRPLLNNAFGVKSAGSPRAKLILVTSSLPEEGKSFMAMQLAMSIAAERERTVMLIDADLARPRLTSLACGDRSVGLSEILEDSDMSIGDVLRKTDIEGLTFLPSGQHHARSTELLASDRMLGFVSEICEKYSKRVIIIDSAPLLVSNDAQVLSSLVGQVALVVRAESTPVHAVREARELITSEVPVSAILNQYKGKSSMGYYGGYYDQSDKQLEIA